MFVLNHVLLDFYGKYEIFRRMQQHPWKFFLPNRAQADLYRAVGMLTPEKRIFLLTSGNGAGKSSGVINLIANLVFPDTNIFDDITDVQTGEHFTGFFDYPFFQNYPEGWPKKIWYVSNKDSLKSIYDEFCQWIPENLWDGKKEGKQSIPVSTIEFKHSDWKIQFMTTDQEPDTFESANVGIMIFDEPPPRDIYVASISRLRKGGIILIPATPLTKAAYFLDDIIDRIGIDPDKWWQTVDVWKNCIERAGEWDLGIYGIHPKGALHEKDILFTLRNFDVDELEAREKGVFAHLSGLVYKGYNPQKVLVKREFTKLASWYMYRFVVDPHDRRPPIACWYKIDNFGSKHIIREWPSIHDSCYGGKKFHEIRSAHPYMIKDFVKWWIEIEKELQINHDRLFSIMDPNYGRKPDIATGQTLAEKFEEEFSKQGFPRKFNVSVNDDLSSGHAAVKDLIRPGVDGWPQLTVDPDCVNIDYGFRHYMYDDWEGKTAEKRIHNEKVLEHGKDAMDLVRYEAMMPWSWTEWEPIREAPEDDYDYSQAKKQPGRPKGAAGL